MKSLCLGWHHFLSTLRFDEPLEFNEGDIGLSGGISLAEPATANPNTAREPRKDFEWLSNGFCKLIKLWNPELLYTGLG